MRRVAAIFRKEFAGILSPFSAALLFVLFSLITGFLFWNSLMYANYLSAQLVLESASSNQAAISFSETLVSPFFVNLGMALVILIPILAMRSFAEEKKLGTFELLFTYPVSDLQIVMGKFAALMAALVLLLLPTIVDFAALYFLKGGFDVNVVLVAYLGLLLIAMLWTALAMLISSLSPNELSSAAFSGLTIAAVWGAGWTGDWLLGSEARWVKEFWPVEHLHDFSRGILDSQTVVFYLVATGFLMFATLLSIETRNWKR